MNNSAPCDNMGQQHLRTRQVRDILGVGCQSHNDHPQRQQQSTAVDNGKSGDEYATTNIAYPGKNGRPAFPRSGLNFDSVAIV